MTLDEEIIAAVKESSLGLASLGIYESTDMTESREEVSMTIRTLVHEGKLMKVGRVYILGEVLSTNPIGPGPKEPPAKIAPAKKKQPIKKVQPAKKVQPKKAAPAPVIIKSTVRPREVAFKTSEPAKKEVDMSKQNSSEVSLIPADLEAALKKFESVMMPVPAGEFSSEIKLEVLDRVARLMHPSIGNVLFACCDDVERSGSVMKSVN